MNETEIRIDQAMKRLGRNQALKGLSLRFQQGLLHTLIGPNGAGKTTLMRTMAGLLTLDSGRVRFLRNGLEVPAKEVRPRIAYMPQAQSLYNDLSIGEHMAFFAKLYGIAREPYRGRRDELLRLSGLERFTDRPAGQLSGGMYKKLGLICALLCSPEIVLLDEPTNGVDPVSRREFWEVLHELSSRQRVTIIMSTAYMDEGERSDCVHLIDRGEKVAEGDPQALLRDLKAPDLQELFLRHSDA